MSRALFTGKGTRIDLGRELGRGGEGSVFETPHWSAAVAKLYHQPPDAQKQAKLRYMVSHASEELLKYAAWPQETLHDTPGGPLVGFLMPKVVQREPVHMLYGPAHRRQTYPNASWEFLLFAARNTADAFDVLHAHGHVLADVNQGNVMVGTDTKVTLIDCDSFQIEAGSVLHLCRVGVGHFTPPELQGLPSFDTVKRTANHDNFGLALLVFHLLFGGRHPYAGVPLRKEVGEALETDIRAMRYAYARDSVARGSKPPPSSIPIALLPAPLTDMFEAAFTERGAQGGRPTAKQWVQQLDALRGQLRKCAATPRMHVYPAQLAACPWCKLETQGVVYFVDIGSAGQSAGSGFVLAKMWAMVESVTPPSHVRIPTVAASSLVPSPLPPGVSKSSDATLVRFVVVTATVVGAAVFTPAFMLILILGAIAFWMAGSIGNEAREKEKTRRTVALQTATSEFEALETRFRKEASPDLFVQKKKQLSELRQQYQGLDGEESRQLEQLKATAEARQKHQFLERWFIDSASIKGVGPSKKAALRSFGIETAADVSWNAVSMVKGFGDVTTRAIVDWRLGCERKFVFDPCRAVAESDKNAVRAKIAVQRRTIEAALNTGLAELQRLRQDAARAVKTLLPQLEDAAQRVAQSQADLTFL